MIFTARQAAVSRVKRRDLLKAADAAQSAAEGTPYRELAAEVEAELAEYEAVRGGRVREFAVTEVDGLGEALIKARLARGWTQRRLAEALGVTEQMVQKDEARAYENAGLARIAEVADVLGYGLSGAFRPVDPADGPASALS